MGKLLPGRGWMAPAIVSIVILAATFACSPNFRFASGPTASPYAADFLQEWIGGHIVRSGDYARFYDVAYARQLQHDQALVGFEWDRSRYLPIVYPPFYYLLVSPLSYFSVPVAAWVWSALMVACLVGTVWMMAKLGLSWRVAVPGTQYPVLSAEAKPAPVTRPLPYLPWLLPAALVFMPTLESLTTCQKGPLSLLILSATYLLLARGQNFTAGIIFGLIAFKPQLALVIAVAMLCKKQWRFVLGGATAGSVLVGLCFLLGPDVCRQYFEFSTGAADYIHTGGYDLTKSHCWYGFFTLLDHGHASNWIKPATLLAGALTIGCVALLLRGKLDAARPQFATQFSGLILATILLSPHLFTYDLMILLLPMYLLGTRISGAGQGSEPPVVGGLLVSIYVAAGVSPAVAAATGVQLVPLLLAGLLVTISRKALLRCGIAQLADDPEAEVAFCGVRFEEPARR